MTSTRVHKYSVALLVRPLAGADLFLGEALFRPLAGADLFPGDGLPEPPGSFPPLPPRFMLRPIARPITAQIPLGRRGARVMATLWSGGVEPLVVGHYHQLGRQSSDKSGVAWSACWGHKCWRPSYSPPGLRHTDRYMYRHRNQPTVVEYSTLPS